MQCGVWNHQMISNRLHVVERLIEQSIRDLVQWFIFSVKAETLPLLELMGRSNGTSLSPSSKHPLQRLRLPSKYSILSIPSLVN